MSNFHPFEVVGRGSETQLQMGENLNDLIQQDKWLKHWISSKLGLLRHSWRHSAVKRGGTRYAPMQMTKVLSQCWYDIGPASQTVDRHKANIGSESRVVHH